MFNERGEQLTTFDERIKNGMLNFNDASNEQRNASGMIVKQEGQQITVQMNTGAETVFQNSADMLRHVQKTGGVIKERTSPEEPIKIVMGEDVRDTFKRLGKEIK